ncbi:hypothetical protein [Paenarthrobacter sp. JL.01a]|uniref:hypothetical protein n=1 Tax=Paenarthrobacter sp. JL.01a TaxID=2979324 RepID=UPI0021C6E81A|nr:hypothetical protein [Paenarthrobacter sp. JL.01a]UXM90926.1 hypothetical protein N5P29_16745 [Paenarthrobacter sp. JL.01a]
MNPEDQRRRFVPPLGKLRKPYAVTTWNAHRAPRLINWNRYPRQIIGIALRLPDGETSAGRTTHHSLSIVWAKPARWWK